MDRRSELALLEALDLLESGAPMEEILARFPSQAAVLHPPLALVGSLSRRPLEPTVWAEFRSEKRLLAAAADLRDRSKQPASIGLFPWPTLVRMTIATVVTALIVLFALGFVATRALPGDPLYGSKVWLEERRLTLASSPEARARLEKLFAGERIDEIRRLLLTGRTGEVSFQGTIEDKSYASWVIATLPVTITSDTQIEPGLETGQSVLVEAHVANGELMAQTITAAPGELLNEPQGESLMMPSPTSTPAASITPTASATAQPAGSGSAPAATPANSSPPSIGATPSPAEHENENENENGEGAENENENDNGDGDEDDGDGGKKSHTGRGNGEDNSNDDEPDEEKDGEDRSGPSGGDEDRSGSGNGREDDDEDRSGSGNGREGDDEDRSESGASEN